VTGTVSGTGIVPLFVTNSGGLTVNTLGGSDTLSADYSGGALSTPISWNAGGGNNDTLLIKSESVAIETYTFTGAAAGSVNVGGSIVNYTALEQITDTGAATNRIFNYASAGGTIAVAAAAPGNNTITSNTGTTVTFPNPTGSLEIDANTGANVVRINSLDAALTAPLILNATGSTSSAIIETSTGNLNVANQTINGGTGSVTLGADLTLAGVGDNGVGTLTIAGTTTVTGATVTLRGADIDIAPAANVGAAGTTTPALDDPVVRGEPADEHRRHQQRRPRHQPDRCRTGPNCGLVLRNGLLRRQHPDGRHHLLQRHRRHGRRIDGRGAVNDGAGKIVLDTSTGTAINGNGGIVSLTPGLGGIVGTLSATNPLLVTGRFFATGLTLNLVLPFAPALAQKITLINDTGLAIFGRSRT